MLGIFKWAAVVVALTLVSPVQNNDSVDIDYESLYGQGQTYDDFLSEAVKRRAMWVRNTEKSSVPEDLGKRVEKIRGSWKLLVVAVDACSDSANIIPYLARLAGTADMIDMRIVDSSIGRAVMEANRTPDGRPATPTIAVLNDTFEPVGFLIERPSTLRDWALENKSKMSTSEFLEKKFEWYDEDSGKESMSEILDIIERASVSDHGDQ
ncbi:MAG: hypothetical protein HKN43_17345 [Rhodothermales bacterium]|nr:hypothetical protein [Rhodothermales bacterium]